jgi:hypothetical protein
MSMSQRISRIRLNHLAGSPQVSRWTIQARPIPAFQRGRAKSREAVEAVTDHWLATQRKPLEDVEPIWFLRWLLRKYFAWRGFACRSHCGTCDGNCYASIEYRGTFDNEADARWAANCDGGEVKPIPFNAALPEETVSYGVGDVPQSEASRFYRQGLSLPFAAVPRSNLERLREKVRATDPVVEGYRAKAV